MTLVIRVTSSAGRSQSTWQMDDSSPFKSTMIIELRSPRVALLFRLSWPLLFPPPECCQLRVQAVLYTYVWMSFLVLFFPVRERWKEYKSRRFKVENIFAFAHYWIVKCRYISRDSSSYWLVQYCRYIWFIYFVTNAYYTYTLHQSL